MLSELQPGAVVRLKKKHPCGGTDWTVYRIGADIGLECNTCLHRVLLTRRELLKKIKVIISIPTISESGDSNE
ncbi:MAG TPA: DUF951 domain-containing protein [Anaerolineales bacterium]|nr:DUF951 domain-containing protein [Anaerolineales bacterium]